MAKARQQYFADETTLQKESREFAITPEIINKLDSIETGAQVNVIETVKVNGTALVPDTNKAVNVEVPDVIDNLFSTSTDDALSAKQGKVLYDYLQNIASRGRYLSNWNCVTGLAVTNPSENPYPYKAGDYYSISNVAAIGGTNYRPDGAQYIIGQASTTVETELVSVSDFYLYDGTSWLLLANSARQIAVDSSLSTTSTNPVENRVVTNAINGKQDTLVAGTNIQIASDGKTISATDTTYSAGTNISIDANNEISAVDTTYTAGANIQISNQNVISATDTVYTAGTNVQINNNVISATDTTYTAGTGISIDSNNVISNTQTSAEWGNITGTLSDQTDLQTALDAKANASDVLTKTNTTSYSPTGDYSPATKKYVDDNAGITKVFTLPADLTTAAAIAVAQDAYDWYNDGNYPVLYWEESSRYFYIGRTSATRINFYQQVQFKNVSILGITDFTYDFITFNFSDGVITSITNTTTTRSVVATGIDYGTPYTPEYDGSPATKKYVDDNVVQKGSTAPSSPTEGMLWYDTTNDQLKVYDGTNWNITGKEYNAGEGISIGNITINGRKGPSPDGFHVPSITEWEGVKTIMDGLNLTSGDDWVNTLFIPFAGFRNRSDASLSSQGSYGYYWSSSPYSEDSNRARYLALDSSSVYASVNNRRANGLSVRCFKDSYVAPTSSWTVIYGTLGNAGIFRDQTNGLISITSDGSTGYTIMDKNLGATTVYDYGDVLSEANMGYMYQWGNNYGFPSTGTISNTSSTQVDASAYGPTNPYSSSTFITGNQDWSSVQNDDLWGDTTETVTQENVISNTGVLSVNGETGNVTIPESNTKTFYLSNTSDLTTGQEIYDYITNNGNPIVSYNNSTYAITEISSTYVRFSCVDIIASTRTSDSYAAQRGLSFTISNGTVTSIQTVVGWTGGYFLRTDVDYVTPYTPLYDGSPATKKYVDDNAGDMSYSDFGWQSKTGATITLDLASTYTPSANFTVNAPATLKDGQTYILRVDNGATAYTMTLGTNITNPFDTDITLTANGIDQFVFLAIGGELELQPEGGGGGVTSVNGQTGAVSLTIPTITTITVTLTSAGWSSNSQTVSATGVTASNTVIVSPAPANISDYADKGVYCSAQGSGTLTFKCSSTPSSNITVNVLIFN